MYRNNRNVELLSPAGNFDCLKAAVNNGADAVYLGGKNFSARAFANNFGEEELIEAVKYAHLHNVRIFVTLNTLLTEKEFNNAVKMADFYYGINVDALLIQDLGLYYFLKEKYPDFELHCSTQMHVHNLEGVKTAKKLGFSRVVVARESDLSFIREACKQDIQVETFVHGAICVSYSGQCLMSSATKNRSANKGMCAQCCRLKYELYDEDDNRVKTKTDYLLSPKDMFLLEDIPELIDAGVSCFKIEGRMKSPAYVAYVTRIYRKAIDSYLEGKEFKLNVEQLHDLKVLFNRGFTNDLLYGKNHLFGQKTPNHLGVEIGEVLYCRNGKAYIRLIEDLNQFDGIRIGDFGCNVNRLYHDDLLVSKVMAGEIAAIDVDEPVKGKVYKTQDHLLEDELNNTSDKKMPLSMKVSVYPEENVSVDLKCLDEEYHYRSDIISQTALKAPLNEENIVKQFSKLSDTIYQIEDIKVDTDNAFLPVKDLNQIRRDAIEAFNVYRLNSFKRIRIIPDYPEDMKIVNEYPDKLIQNDSKIMCGNDVYEVSDVINTKSVYPNGDHVVISEFGGLLKKYPHKMAYYTLNCCNSYCYEFLRKHGFEYIVLSSELHEDQIKDLIEAYEKRNGEMIRPIVFEKGDRVLMYLKSDPFEEYMKEGIRYYLKDWEHRYDIRKMGEITALIERGYRNEIGLQDVVKLTIDIN